MLRELDAARTETEETIKRQREFVADASHELRTPLTSILANLELLEDALVGGADEDDVPAVASALRSSKRMNRLVGDLLLLARADAGRTASGDRMRPRRDRAPRRSRRSTPVADGHELASRIDGPRAGRREPRRAAPDGAQPARERDPPHAGGHQRSGCGSTARRRPRQAGGRRRRPRAARRAWRTRSSSASSAARAPPTAPRATARAPAWGCRSSGPSPSPTTGRVVAEPLQARRRPVHRLAAAREATGAREQFERTLHCAVEEPFRSRVEYSRRGRDNSAAASPP